MTEPRLTASLTTEQCITAYLRQETQSRRKAKRYLRDHGLPGTADVLDEALARAKTAGADEMLERRLSEIEADAERDRIAFEADMLAKANAGQIEAVCMAMIDCDNAEHDTERMTTAVQAWSKATAADAAEHFAREDLPAECFDDLVGLVRMAWKDAHWASARRELEAKARKHARYSVAQVRRGSMAIMDQAEFDDRDHAVDYLALLYTPSDATAMSYYTLLEA